MTTLRIGTRGSQLALWQARTVAARLEAAHPGLTCEIVVIRTSGDRLGEAPLSEAGGKRLFVREIEEALLDGRVDMAVHSAKDMPVAAVDGLIVAAVLPREEPWDAIVLPAGAPGPSIAPDAADASGAVGTSGAAAAPGASGGPGTASASRASHVQEPLDAASPSALAEQLISLMSRIDAAADPGRAGARDGAIVIGTSSVRRAAQLRHVLPSATFAPIRGNLDTRLRKLDEGQYDMLVLAAAGLKRLGAGDRISARLPLDACVPAPGQGIVAVQVRTDDDETRARVAAIDDPETAPSLAAEQAVVDALGGGCQTPIGALAIPVDGGRLELHAIVIALDGSRALRATAIGPAREAREVGRRAAAELLSQGAAEILGASASA